MSDHFSEDQLNRLKNELVMAEKLNEEKILPQMLQAIQRYTGKHIPFIAQDWDIVLNEIYPIIQNELPSIFFRNPRVFLKPREKTFLAKRRNPITQQMEEIFLDSSKSARTQEAILNYKLQEIRYKEEVRKVLTDALLFKHGILWHGYKGNFGMTEEQSLYIQDEDVFVKRLSPNRFLFDPCVSLGEIEDARWIARSFDMPLDDLLEDSELDVDKKLVKGEVGYGNVINEKPQNSGGKDTIVIGGYTKTLVDYTDGDFRKSMYSRFVRIYEFLIRPSRKELREGKKGKMLLYTKEQSRPLREGSWPYKAEGWPGKILSFNHVPESIFGLSDLEIWSSIADQKNMVVNLQLRDAQANSKVWVFFDKSGMDEETVQKIQSGQQTVVGVDGPPGAKISVSSPGGAASAPLYMLDGRIQNNLDEKSGVMDLKKGVLRSGEESATSVRIREAGTSSRPAYRQDLMADFLRDSCHYLNQLIKQFYPVDKAVRIVGSLDIEWSDNPSREEVQADVDVEIDVVSMAPENPEKEIQELYAILNLMVQAIQNPELKIKLQQEGKTFNFAPIIENILMRLRIRNPEVFRNIRPEESQGFVSVSEIRAAKENVNLALQGQPPSSAPAIGQDHSARLEMYGEIANILEAAGLGDSQTIQLLKQLIITHQALLEEEQQTQSPRIGSSKDFPKSFMKPVGAMSGALS